MTTLARTAPVHVPLNLRALAFVFLGLFLGSSLGSRALAAAALDAGQQKFLSEAQSYQQQVETNLQLAQQTAGPGTAAPPASRARLALVRLESAKQALPQVSARLERLPSGHPDVQALRQRFDAASSAVAQLENRLTGGSAAAATSGGVTASGARLDYRQEESLKNARYHAREVEGGAAALTQLVEQLRPVADWKTIDHRLVQRGINTIADARKRAGQAGEHLATLPPDGQGVKPVADALAQAVAAVDAAAVFLAPLHEKLVALVSPASYPSLAADIARLRELSSMYGNSSIVLENRLRAAELIRDAAAVGAERDRLVAAYGSLIQQRTAEGEQLAGINSYFAERLAAFMAAAREQLAALPGEIEAHLAEADGMADQAVVNQTPAFFTGGIPQRLEWAQEKVVLLEALDPAGGAAMKEKLAQFRRRLAQRESALRESIVASNELPPDRYSGGDRDEIGRIATAALKKILPDARVLSVRIPSQDWKREAMWRYQAGSWYKIDRSRLQAQLIVAHDDRLAAIRAVDLWKNHISGDEITAAPLHGRDEELPPQYFLPLSKMK
jgi:hypothetical protein